MQNFLEKSLGLMIGLVVDYTINISKYKPLSCIYQITKRIGPSKK